MPGEQLHFTFPEPSPSLASLFFGQDGISNLQVLRQWKVWPKRFLALTGPERSGVSTVLRAWATEVEGEFLRPEDWLDENADVISKMLDRPVAIDDADKVRPSSALLTLLNLAVEQGQTVLLGGHGNPAEWHFAPPDLVSRLAAVTRLVLPPLDDEGFDRRLRAACLRRFIDLPSETMKFVRPRLDRSYAAIEAFADQLNAVMGSENKPASVPVAREILEKMNAIDDEPFQHNAD